MDTEYIEDPSVATRDKVTALFNLLCCMETAVNWGATFGLGFILAIAALGHGPNCLACCVCHVREKFRRKYNLPPAFGLPPGIDDCLVSFLCPYFSSHQQLREMLVRGEHGPGLHIAEVCPESYMNALPTAHAVRKAITAPPAQHQGMEVNNTGVGGLRNGYDVGLDRPHVQIVE